MYKFILLFLLIVFLTGCELSYIIRSAEGQFDLLSKKQSFQKALNNPKIDDETKRKIRLAQEVKTFAEKSLGLVHTKNYDSFVLLEDRYVTYAVTAAKKDELKAHYWSFPLVGQVPYKGFFKSKEAQLEADYLKKQNLDVMVRGVSAYSTLGWFSDPLLSSMTQDEDFNLVDTLIHETTHATIYIKNNSEFNERLATFVGEKGAELFFLQEEGLNSPTLQKSKLERADAQIFFNFINNEISQIDNFYKAAQNHPDLMFEREEQFKKIKSRFLEICKPKLKSRRFDFFSQMTINNAVLIGFKMYYSKLDIFEQLYLKSKKNWSDFFKTIEGLKKSSNPEKELEKILQI